MAPLTVDVVVQGNAEGKEIKEVIFTINDSEVGKATTSPYRMDYDFSQLSPGDYTITAIIHDTDDEEINRTSIQVNVTAPEGVTSSEETTETPEATVTSIFKPTSTPAPGLLQGGGNNLLLIVGIGAGVLVLIVIIIAVIVINTLKKKSEKNYIPPEEPTPSAPPSYGADKTMDGFSLGQQQQVYSGPQGAFAGEPGGLFAHSG